MEPPPFDVKFHVRTPCLSLSSTRYAEVEVCAQARQCNVPFWSHRLQPSRVRKSHPSTLHHRYNRIMNYNKNSWTLILTSKHNNHPPSQIELNYWTTTTEKPQTLTLVCGSYSVTFLNQAHIFERCALSADVRSDIKRLVFERTWTSYSTLLKHSMLHRQQNWGDVYDHLMSSTIFTVISSENQEENDNGRNWILSIISH